MTSTARPLRTHLGRWRSPRLASLALAPALLVAVAAASASCGSEGTPPGDGDVGDGDGDTGADTYAPGMTRAGDIWDVMLVEASPAPPDRENNIWIFHVMDGGSMVSGLDVKITPWMPAHGHGTTPADILAVEQEDTPGEYSVPSFNLPMPGLWEFTVSIESEDASDAVLFTFQIEG